MFELMKILRKDNYNTDERVNLAQLRPGSTVGFGFLPQRNISGCRMKIKAINSYIFGEDTFLSYVLDNFDNDINLIVSKDEDSADNILSLSQRIERRLYSILFLTNEPESWFSMKPGESLLTSHRVMGMQQSWVASRYKLVLVTQGTLVEGDYRLLKKPYENGRPFDYVLLVDEDNEHALEAEKYEDGTLIVYSTVYRPATDIGEITNPPALAPETKLPSLGHLKKVKDVKDDTSILELTEVVEEEKPAGITKIKAKMNGSTHAEAEKKPQEVQQQAHGDMLIIDTKLASKILNEAQNNDVSLSDLIRKVIDLPSNINEQILISLSLTDSEYKDLAQRYGLSAADHEGVKRQIVKELQQFAGSKK